MKKVRVIATVAFTVEGEDDNEIFDYARDRVEEMTYCIRECERVETDTDFVELD